MGFPTAVPTSQHMERRSRTLGFAGGAGVGLLGGLVGLGGAEFRLPLLLGLFGFVALAAVIVNKAMSLAVVLAALPARLSAVPLSAVAHEWGPVVNLLAGSLIGPSQVMARLVEYVRRNLFSPPLTAIIAALSMALGLVLLSGALVQPLAAFAIAFAVFYGAGQGLTSIVRGVLPLHYFGAAGYGRT